MSDKKISQLTAATTPIAGTSVVPIVPVSASQTYKVAVSDIAAYVAADSTSLSSIAGSSQVSTAISSKAIAMALVFS